MTDNTSRKTTLPHGLRVVTETIPHVRSASIGIWIDTGSRDETPSQNGISHFVEHMVFKGTRNRSVRDIARSVESVGGYLNAFTGKEHTCYYARVLDEHIDLALDVLADLVLQATFPKNEMEKEKGVVIEELKQTEDDADDIIHDYFERELYGEHPLGLTIIGSERNLRNFTRNDLIAFRRTSYAPKRIVVAAAGNVRHERIVEAVQRHLGTRSFEKNIRGANLAPRNVPKSLAVGGEKVYDRPIQQAHVVLGAAGYSLRDDARFPLMLMNTILGDGMSSRLFQNIREKYGFAYSVYSFANLLSDSGSVGAYIGTDTAHIEKCIDLVWKEFDSLCKRAISKRDSERTKAQLKGNLMLSLENIPNRMIRLGSSELYYGEQASLDWVIKQIDAVTPDHIHDLAKNLFQRDRFCTIIFKPNGNAAVPESRE
jgi:predicted Zn-dependent peptidase